MLAPLSRIALSAILFSAWMALLLFGFTFGGVVYLLLVVSLALFPWKNLRL